MNAPRLILDLQQANQIAQRIYACLDAPTIATQITEGLVQQFGCALARIWLVEPDRTHLKLVASAGLYTHTDGSFSRVPMGSFKVGKIAQNRVSFLSNNFPNETWVKDRDWAIQHRIQGFAGYPLATPKIVVGVLAVFSYEPLEPEFLEVLLSLCTTTTVALGNAIQFQQAQQFWQGTHQRPTVPTIHPPMLSDLLAQILDQIPLQLLGTERLLNLSLTYLFIKLAELLQNLGCMTCSLTYRDELVVLSAIVLLPSELAPSQEAVIPDSLGQLVFASSCLGGTLETTIDTSRKALQIRLQMPDIQAESNIQVTVQCRSSVLQLAFTQMVQAAGFGLGGIPSKTMPLITDCSSLIQESQSVIWIQQSMESVTKIPQGIKAQIALSITIEELRRVIQAVGSGEEWGIDDTLETQRMLSEREQDVMNLLTQGLRDREIASQLHISESTVKFHINNTLTKLKAKTRVQALYELMKNGWLI